MQVILYSKPDCSLCDQLKVDLAEMQHEVEFELVESNIEEDADLFERFRYLIPVLEIGDGELLYPPHRWYTLLSALQEGRDRLQERW